MYDPQWGDGDEVLGYAINYLSRHVWRVSPLYELDDLLQESYILFVKLTERYEFENEKHFMAMWKRCLHNWLCSLANHRTSRRESRLMSGDSFLGRGCSVNKVSDDDRSIDFVRLQDRCYDEQKRKVHRADASYVDRCYDGDREYDWQLHVREAPPPVRQLVAAVTKPVKVKRVHRRRCEGGRETTNDFLCRLASVSSKIPLRRIFERWLVGEPNM